MEEWNENPNQTTGYPETLWGNIENPIQFTRIWPISINHWFINLDSGKNKEKCLEITFFSMY